jgi:hypothetical protein
LRCFWIIIGGKARFLYWQKNRTLKQNQSPVFWLELASTWQLTSFFSESFDDLKQFRSEAAENMDIPIQASGTHSNSKSLPKIRVYTEFAAEPVAIMLLATLPSMGR